VHRERVVHLERQRVRAAEAAEAAAKARDEAATASSG
jgi:hypothetical protein